MIIILINNTLCRYPILTYHLQTQMGSIKCAWLYETNIDFLVLILIKSELNIK